MLVDPTMATETTGKQGRRFGDVRFVFEGISSTFLGQPGETVEGKREDSREHSEFCFSHV